MLNLSIYGNLDTRTILCLTATKFQPFKFSVLGFVFVYIYNIQIIMILYDFRLWPGVKSQGHTTADSQPVIPS
jgi:hypothetical protein